MKFILFGRCPSKKNSKQIVCRGARPILLPSKAHKEWHESASWELKEQKVPYFDKVKRLDFTLYAPDLRIGDLSNRFDSVADLLVDNGIIDDDNWNILGNVWMFFGGVDRLKPRVEVEIL